MLMIFFCATSIILLAEIALQRVWSPAYFNSGVVVYNKRINLDTPATMLPLDDMLATRFQSDGFRPSILFKSQSTTRMAFREKLLEFPGPRVHPLMHGSMSLFPQDQAIVLIGRLNWWMIALISVIIALCIEEMDYIPGVLFSLYTVLLYLIQRRRYDKISKAVSELMM